MTKITDRLKKIKPTEDFTYELKVNKTLLSIDIIVINNND